MTTVDAKLIVPFLDFTVIDTRIAELSIENRWKQNWFIKNKFQNMKVNQSICFVTIKTI